jgi:hypothetical protein
MGWRWGWLAGALLVAGCYQPSAQGRAELVQIEISSAETAASLDALEERLFADQARVRLWAEMAQRHRQVSALACSNAALHQTQMVSLAGRQAEKKRSRRGKLAVVPVQGGIGGPR